MTVKSQTLLLKIGREFFLEKRKYARQSYFNMSLKENIRHFKSRFVIFLRCNFGLLNEEHDWLKFHYFTHRFVK